MAIIAKNFKGNFAKNQMLAILTEASTQADAVRDNFQQIKFVYADNQSQTSGLNYGTDFDGYAEITWNAVSNGSVSKSNTPVINIDAGTTINYLGLIQPEVAGSGWQTMIEFTIDAETFTYAGSITITSATLSVSSTIG